MAKVKNDPKKYLKRSDLAPRRVGGKGGEAAAEPKNGSDGFLIAPIDRNFYIDFRPTRSDNGKR